VARVRKPKGPSRRGTLTRSHNEDAVRSGDRRGVRRENHWFVCRDAIAVSPRVAAGSPGTKTRTRR
jgi:hypothetical protein